jgi:hypothetical protein
VQSYQQPATVSEVSWKATTRERNHPRDERSREEPRRRANEVSLRASDASSGSTIRPSEASGG